METALVLFAYKLFDSISGETVESLANNALYDVLKSLFIPSDLKKAQEALKQNEEHFITIMETMISNNQKLAEQISELYNKSDGDITRVVNGKNNDKKNYNKSINEIKKGDYLNAINFLNKIPKNSQDVKDAKLLTIACNLCSRQISSIDKEKIEEDFYYLTRNYTHSYLGLVLIGIIYYDYFHKQGIKPRDSSWTLKKIARKISLANHHDNLSFIVLRLNASEEAKRQLGIRNTLKEETFTMSGLPNYMEGYQCFHNISNNNLINGEEIRTSKLNDVSKRRWHYLYRLDEAHLGKEQKDMITHIQHDINDNESSLHSLLKWLNILAWGSVLGVIILAFLFQYLAFSLVIICSTLFFLLKRNKNINRLTKSIQSDKKLCEHLQDEINYLREQIPTDIPISKEMRIELLIDLNHIKEESLKRLESKKHKEDKKNHSINFQEWAFLQPIVNKGKLGFEQTGVQDIILDIEDKIATYTLDTNRHEPFYRVLFLQYIYLLDDGVNTYSLFYDFVTQKEYGNRSETFQYKHISNISISEIKLKSNDVYKRLNISNELIQNIYNKDFHLLSFAVSSGKTLHCVIADEDISQEMQNLFVDTDQKVDVNKQLTYKKEHTPKSILKEDNTTEKNTKKTSLKSAYKTLKCIKKKVKKAQKITVKYT